MRPAGIEKRVNKIRQIAGNCILPLYLQTFSGWPVNRMFIGDGGLAQLARALPWHGRGHRFDSDILHIHCESAEIPSEYGRSIILCLSSPGRQSESLSAGQFFCCRLGNCARFSYPLRINRPDPEFRAFLVSHTCYPLVKIDHAARPVCHR